MSSGIELCPPPEGSIALGPLEDGCVGDRTPREALLGSGSVFVVARVRRGDEDLACKRLLPQHRGTTAARRSMVREARALALAHHPALPALREVGADEHGPYLLETVVAGTSLRAVKERWAGRLPRHLALHLAREAVATMMDLHALTDALGPVGLVHGDVSPDNLRMSAHGAIRLLDLGSARFRDFPPELETAARGTAPYAAPELTRGEVVGSQRCDVYALAATVAWLLLDGESPLVAPRDEAALVMSIGERGIDPACLAPLPGSIRAALIALLTFDPAARGADLGALASALHP